MKPKDTIYIDVDDEITAVINKVANSSSKLVVLVLPKRASVFHSSVNLKLLKNKALKAGKNLVLVSTDANLLSLAGVVGINVAKNLQDKPTIPKVNQPTDTVSDFESESEDKSTNIEPNEIGKVAAMSAIGISDIDDQEVIEFDNDVKKDSLGAQAANLKDKKAKINKKLKVPDFGRFQKILMIAVLAIIVLAGLYVYAFIFAPKAKIIIQSSTSTLSSTIPFTLDSTQSTGSATNQIIPANLQTVQKTVTSSAVSTTGTKQVGIYATGSITVTNPGNNYASDIPAGTVFTETNSGNTYQTTSDATLPACNTSHGFCTPSTSVVVNVAATAYGTNYNIKSANDYTSQLGAISGTNFYGTDMSGATPPYNVNIVTAADIANAQKQLVAPVSATIEQQLATAITAAGFTPLPSTFVAATPIITPSNTAGTQTNTVTVSGSYSFSMYGAHPSDLDTLITAQVDQSSNFNSTKQSILDTGSNAATFTVDSSTATSAKVSMHVSSVIGPKLNITNLINQSVGKSNPYVINNISSIPGVQSVTIKYSPFWVTAMPHNAKKITIILEKANGSAA
jgi:hypothetical protein